MYTKVMTFLLALILVVSLVACTSQAEAEEVEGLTSAYMIILGVLEAQNEISTYQFDLDMDIGATTMSEDEAFQGDIGMDLKGAVDINNGKMSMDMNMDMIAVGEDKIEISMGMYLIDNVMYMMMNIPEMGPMWMKSDMPGVDWDEFDQVESQIELLVDAIRVNVLGSEKVNGIDCFVLEIIPDMDQLWEIAMQQSGVTGEEMLPGIDEEFLQDAFQGFSVMQWVAKDTYFLLKAKVDMTMEITPESMGVFEDTGVMAMDITMDLLAYGYNQPVSIVLPAGAEEAIDIPAFMDFGETTY